MEDVTKRMKKMSNYLMDLKKILTLLTTLTLFNAYSSELTVAQYLEQKEKAAPAFNTRELSSNFASWGIDPNNIHSSINLLEAWKIYKKSKDVLVAVVDTGVDITHTYLRENIYTLNGRATASNFGLDFSRNDLFKKSKYQPTDYHGHGTHVSGIVKSIYPSVKLLPIKYYKVEASGQENLEATIKALEFAVNNNVPIINYSGGGPQASTEELRILKLAQQKGILVVAAAGNNEQNLDLKENAYYPASYGLDNVISVGAYGKNLGLLESSNYGRSTVDIMAPGDQIKSSIPQNRAGYLSGTSQATAFVTGVASLIKSNFPDLKASEIKNIIIRSAKKEVQFLALCSSGGRLDARNALLEAKQYISEKRNIKKLALVK